MTTIALKIKNLTIEPVFEKDVSAVVLATNDNPAVVLSEKESFNSFEKSPSNWHITGLDVENIYALNNQTQREFEGTIAEFNSLLKG